MKTTKLLPFLSIGAVAAVATPIALTSCSSSLSVDLMKVYNPNIDRANAFTTTKTTKELTEWYFEGVKKNANIYAQDFYYSHSLYINYLTATKIVKMESANAYISNIYVDTILSAKGKISYALSCEITYNYKGYPDENSGLVPQYSNFLIEGNFKFKFKNVPMVMYYYSDAGFIDGWANQILVEEKDGEYTIPVEYDNLWSIEQDGKVTITDEGTTEGVYHKIVYPFETITSAKTSQEFLDNLVNQLAITRLSLTDVVSSYYMSKMNLEGK